MTFHQNVILIPGRIELPSLCDVKCDRMFLSCPKLKFHLQIIRGQWNRKMNSIINQKKMLRTCQKHEDIPASKVQVKTAD